jgi:hypothetical protein
MKRNGTPRNVTNSVPENLTPAQELAVGALLAGKTVTDAAGVAGVDRATVHRWLRESFAVQAAVNAGRRELRRAAYRRLEGLAEKAVDCVAKAIDRGDIKAALAVLKGLRVLSPVPIGSEDAAELSRQAELEATLAGLHTGYPVEI